MATTGGSDAEAVGGDSDAVVRPAPAEAAAVLSGAAFVRLLAPTDGDGAAAAGALARALSAVDVPFQVGLAPTAADRRRRLGAVDPREGDRTVLVGTDPRASDADRATAGADARADTDPGPDVRVTGGPVAPAAAEVAAELAGRSVPLDVLALAGAVAAGRRPVPADADPGGPDPGESDGPVADALGRVRAAGALERRPGVAGPTADPADALAHSTLVHAPQSGDRASAADALSGVVPGAAPGASDADGDGDGDAGADGSAAGGPSPGTGPAVDADPVAADAGTLDDEARRRAASAVAAATVGAEGATDRAAVAVGRALRPHAVVAPDVAPDGGADAGAGDDGPGEAGTVGGGRPFPAATLEGFADVLDAAAREAPGTATALALGRPVRSAALSAWREHARRAHGAVRSATTRRFDGLLVARVGTAPVGTVARLLRDFRSPEPAVLVAGDRRAALAADRDVTAGLCRAADAVGGRADVRAGGRRGLVVYGDDADPAAAVAAVREVL